MGTCAVLGSWLILYMIKFIYDKTFSICWGAAVER